AFEIVDRADLARRMARQREHELVGRDARAIIAHATQPYAAVFDFDVDTRRTGIEAVLDQLLDDGCGALDDLAGRDLVDELLGKDANGHGRRAGAENRAQDTGRPAGWPLAASLNSLSARCRSRRRRHRRRCSPRPRNWTWRATERSRCRAAGSYRNTSARR